MSEAEKQYVPGQVEWLQMTFHRTPNSEGIPFLGYVQEFQFFEDIMSPAMTGTALISDSVGIASSLGIVGGEELHIEFKTPALDGRTNIFKREFVIFELESKLIDTFKVAFIIQFMSKPAYLDSMRKINHSLKGEATDVISNILDNYLGVPKSDPIYGGWADKNGADTNLNFQTDSSIKNTINFIAPNWSPLKTINHITSICKNSESNNAADYLFFEGVKGFNFWSYRELVSMEENGEFFFDNHTNRDDKGVRDFAREYQTARTLHIDKQFNMIDRLDYGIYKNSLVDFDIIKKSISYGEYNYFTFRAQAENQSLNPYQLNSPLPALNPPVVCSIAPHISFGADDPMMQKKLSRASLGLLSSVSIDISICGRTDLEVGDTIWLNVPDALGNTKGDSDGNDRILTGKYLIVNICHRVNEKVHEMILKLTTDSYSRSVI